MTASENSYLGIAKQTAKGSVNSTHADFACFPFIEGAMSPNNVTLPLDMEIGGGALQRQVIKAGVFSAGQFNFIPRPNTLGRLLTAFFGAVSTTGSTGYTHTIKFAADQFDARWLTVRSQSGQLQGEQFQDVRVQSLVLNWEAANYIRGQLGLIGLLPTPNMATSSWSLGSKVDSSPPLIAPVSAIEVPTATSLKVLSGSIAFVSNIPMDDQWIVGSYSPDSLDVNQKSVIVQLNVKIESKAIYNKMAYDPNDGAAWTANLFRESDVKLLFKSDQNIGGAPYSLDLNGHSTEDNVVWSVSPIQMRAGRSIVAQVTGQFIASSSGDPVTVTLYNGDAGTKY